MPQNQIYLEENIIITILSAKGYKVSYFFSKRSLIPPTELNMLVAS